MGIHIMPPLYKVVMPPLFTTIFYPDADPESTSVDGGVANLTLFQTFAQSRAGPGTDAWPSGSVYMCRMRVSGAASPANWYEFARFICLFDMSSILGRTVKTAKLGIYGISKQDTEGKNPAINLYTSNPASNTNLVAADYSALGTTPLATSIPYASFDPAGWNILTLNAQGKAHINAALASDGIVKLGIREALYDAANIDPFPGLKNRIIDFMWEDVENPLGHKPYLEVVYA